MIVGIVSLGLLIVNIGCRVEKKLDKTHLPEMVFGESGLVLKHDKTSTNIHINAFDALGGWKKEGLPFIEVLAVVQWKFRR